MKLKAFVMLTALALATPVVAHDAKPLHGGRIVYAGNFHVEMVANGNAVDVYLISHQNKQMPLTGYKGLAILSIPMYLFYELSILIGLLLTRKKRREEPTPA